MVLEKTVNVWTSNNEGMPFVGWIFKLFEISFMLSYDFYTPVFRWDVSWYGAFCLSIRPVKFFQISYVGVFGCLVN